MNDCNAYRSCRLIGKCKMENGIQTVEQHHKGNGLDNIKIEMHQCGTLRITVGADTGNQCSCSRSDIRTHNQWNGRQIRNSSGG